jgi:hypothetical protein
MEQEKLDKVMTEGPVNLDEHFGMAAHESEADSAKT